MSPLAPHETPDAGKDSRRLPQDEPLVSIVIPAFNETENIFLIHRRIAEVLGPPAVCCWEVLFVDDGSLDGTWSIITSLAGTDGRVRGIRLSRNFGHQYALLAGLEMAKGEAVISMDCDLQHPVEMLPLLIEKWRAGFKVVKTLRHDPPELSRFKRWTSRLFYRLFSFLSGVRMQPGLADFRLLDRQALAELLRFQEEGLFLRGITEWIGFPACEIDYEAGVRRHGQSRYNFRKMCSLAWKGVSSFSIMPLRVGVLIGLVGCGISAVGVFYAFLEKMFGDGIMPGWASIFIIISFLFSILFLYLGILGEYIGRIVIEVRRRPRFIVREMAGFDKWQHFPHD